MNDINTCTFSGNLTRDAEMKYTNGGMAVCNFSLAVNESWSGKDYASFFDFTIWGKYAEAMVNLLKTGVSITVTSKAKQERWEQDGKTRSKVKFTAESIRLFPKSTNNTEPAHPIEHKIDDFNDVIY